MSKEIDDLLEINQEGPIAENPNIENGFIKHFLIHLGIFVALIGTGVFLASQGSGYDSLGVAFIFGILLLLFLIVIIVEAIVYQVKKNIPCRNSCLLLLLIYLITTIGGLSVLGL